MRLSRFEYIKPSSASEALCELEKNSGNAKLIAGGTDILVSMKQRILNPGILIGLKHLKELSGISSDNNSLKIGSLTTLSELLKDSNIADKFPALHKGVAAVASKHIRNSATIGGNICLNTRCWYYNQTKLWRAARELCHKTGGNVCHEINGASRCHAINNSDSAPALLVLNSKIIAANKGSERTIPIKDFFNDDGKYHTILSDKEILTSILVPFPENRQFSTFIKMSSRRGIDFAFGSVAASLTLSGKKISELKIAAGSFTSSPVRLQKTAEIIMESGLTEKAIEAAREKATSEVGILTNLFTKSGYKRQLLKALVGKALGELKNQANIKKEQ